METGGRAGRRISLVVPESKREKGSRAESGQDRQLRRNRAGGSWTTTDQLPVGSNATSARSSQICEAVLPASTSPPKAALGISCCSQTTLPVRQRMA